MARIDYLGNEAGGLSFGHFLTHNGKIFHLNFGWAGQGAAQTKDLSVVVGAKDIHMKGLQLATLGTWTASILEGPTGVTGGTTLTPWNRSRRSAEVPLSVFKLDPTGTTGGTSLPLGKILAATGVGNNNTVGGVAGAWEDEIILKALTTYVFRFVSGATTGNEINVQAVFLEAKA